jgi:hypothetical protein
MWQLINRETGKAQEGDHNLEFKIGNNIISDPKEITELLNMNFRNTVAKAVKQNINKGSYNNLHQEIKHCPNSIFIPPLTEKEVVSIAKSLKGKITAGYDDIPESLVKQCMQLIKGPLTHIYNGALKSGVLLDE